MTEEKDLRKMRRGDLLDLLENQMRENEYLQDKIKTLNDRLDDRTIRLAEAGSIAEAALRVNEIFRIAQEAGDQYLENIARLNEEKETEYQKLIQKADEECQKMRQEAEEACHRMQQETEEKCMGMIRDTEAECQGLRQETKKKCEDVLLMVRQMINENI